LKKKILGIFVCMLLIATALPAVGTTNIEKTDNISSDPKSASTGVVWSDNFDSYSLGQLLDGTPDDGVGQADIIHEFTGLNSGNWTYTEWVYVPDDYAGGSCIFLGSYYVSGNMAVSRWHLGVSFDGDSDVVYDYYGGVANLPLITDQWVELRVELNFEEDWCECYYNDELLVAGIWTDMGYGDGYYNLAGLDFCWGDVSIYHDNLSIEGETNGLESNLDCDGSLNWIDVPAGSTVTGNFTVENIGDPGSRLEWIIDG